MIKCARRREGEVFLLLVTRSVTRFSGFEMMIFFLFPEMGLFFRSDK